jgi:hypothetical protein
MLNHRYKYFFQLFYVSHHLYVLWWALLIVHAPNFWKWFIGPAIFYLCERLWSLRIVNRARYGKTFIQEGITYPSKVRIICHRMNKDSRGGQFAPAPIKNKIKYVI